LGVDAPAVGNEHAPEAAAANRRLVLDKEVNLRYGIQERGNDGVWLAYVYADGIFVNRELVEEGLALVAPLANDEELLGDLIRAERDATRDRRGIWKDSVIEPYQVRSQKRDYKPWASEEERRTGVKK
jgi:endonuclease YncB( thermonuclease family)